MTLSLKKACHLSLKKGTSLVPPKGHAICPSKRAHHLSIKKGSPFVPNDGDLHNIYMCPSIWCNRNNLVSQKTATHLSLNKDHPYDMSLKKKKPVCALCFTRSYITHLSVKRQPLCPSLKAVHDWLSFVPQKGQLVVAVCPSKFITIIMTLWSWFIMYNKPCSKTLK